MLEEEAIKFAALHLEELADKWWQHGLVTLEHNQVITYIEFTKRLIDHFNRKDLEINYKDLAQMKQMGTINNYITKL